MEHEAGETAGLYDAAALAALACEIGARPQGAPGFADVAGAVRAVRREPGALVIDYDPAAADTLAAVVAAERLCCAEIGWHLEGAAPAPAGGPPLRLRIEASSAQLDVLEGLFEPGPR